MTENEKLLWRFADAARNHAEMSTAVNELPEHLSKHLPVDKLWREKHELCGEILKRMGEDET